MTPVPWLWLYGPSGTGKTAVGYELFTQLAADGHRMGYIEIDQLGMCLPIDGPGRSRIKVANLLCALRNFDAAGAAGIVVSGDIAGSAMDDVLRLAIARPILCRLRARSTTSESRLRDRGAPPEYAQDARTYDDRFSQVGDLEVETDDLSVQEVAGEIRRRIGAWPPQLHRTAGSNPAPFAHEAAPPEAAVLICGPTASGKSAVAWEVFRGSVAGGVKTAYLDLAQIGFLRPQDETDPTNLRLRARNLETFWRAFAREGAHRIVLSGEIDGHVDVEIFRRALSGAKPYVCSLAASLDELTKRALMRGQRRATQLPGDDLRGRSETDLRDVASVGAQRAGVLRESFAPDLEVNTDDLTVAEVATRISSNAFPKVGRGAT